EVLRGAPRAGHGSEAARAPRRGSVRGSRRIARARPQRWRYRQRPPLQALSAAERGVLRMHMRADSCLVHVRLRQEDGFGLIELLMAMTILNIGILATVAAFNSGIVALRHAGKVSTASVLADKQMELYRSLTYGSIALDSSSIPASAPYNSDPAWASVQVTTTCTTPLSDECNASRTTTGPDHHTYRIDTYIVNSNPLTTYT